MPIEEINVAIATLETHLKHYENVLDDTTSNNMIFLKAKIALRQLRRVTQELNELKKMKEGNN